MSAVSGAVVLGVAAAAIAELPKVFQAWVPEDFWYSIGWVLLPVFVTLGVGHLIWRRGLGDRRYDGFGDMIIHIHSPAHPDSPSRWGLRSFVSLALSLVGLPTGSEGAAIEAAHGLAIRNRSRSSRWFEQRRRTDAAMALAAGMSAAFQAPFAAVLIPIELGIGGRTISVAITAISAFLAGRFFSWLTPLSIDRFEVSGVLASFRFDRPAHWLGALIIALVAGLLGALVTPLIRIARESLVFSEDRFWWLRPILGGVLLIGLYLVLPQAQVPPWALLEQTLWMHRGSAEIALIFSGQLLALIVVVAAFGTAGVFWPIFTLGGLMAVALSGGALGAGPDLAGPAGLVGASALLAAVLGAPLSSAILAYELTGSVHLLLPCMIAAAISKRIQALLRSRSWIDRDLELRGVRLVEGRSAAVLESVLVRDAMVADHESVHELEPLSELRGRLLRSRYPFLPVVNSQGIYSGMITVDMVREYLDSSDEAEQAGESPSNVPLSSLLEAKDLLYRSGFRTEAVKVNEPLTATVGLFEEIPCIPVLDEGSRVVGLLFVHHVRLAYDREVARRSFIDSLPGAV